MKNRIVMTVKGKACDCCALAIGAYGACAAGLDWSIVSPEMSAAADFVVRRFCMRPARPVKRCRFFGRKFSGVH
ncbi:hypothetical protein GCM10007388_09190 [Pseudoduganella plicata]|uniref:Uncharacterized protein n=1 Tax=Pseudoduganella plicata TaxID=321984 RepID=A0AA88C7A4_9BURK|nr:hypothetical protein GCM10007388_09190 [Pseudoduganella plicata]